MGGGGGGNCQFRPIHPAPALFRRRRKRGLGSPTLPKRNVLPFRRQQAFAPKLRETTQAMPPGEPLEFRRAPRARSAELLRPEEATLVPGDPHERVGRRSNGRSSGRTRETMPWGRPLIPNTNSTGRANQGSQLLENSSRCFATDAPERALAHTGAGESEGRPRGALPGGGQAQAP